MHVDIRILLILSCSSTVLKGDTDKNDSIFIPTHEWQVVRKGTPIPKGLHIRHNLETGLTEAKLMDDKSTENISSENLDKIKSSNSLTLHPDESLNKKNQQESKDAMKPTDQLKIRIEDLKEQLKKLKSDEGKTAALNSGNANSLETKRDKFRTYEELKTELHNIKLNVTNYAELLTAFFTRFEAHKDFIIIGNLNNSRVEDILDILNNLEYLIHYIDNAQLFANMEGMTKIISPCLNSTNDEIKAESLKLLGAAVQSNPKVQVKALENDYIQKLLHMIVIHNNIKIRSRCIFALSTLVRQFPAAQKAFVDHGGLEIFAKILDHSDEQIQTRVMNLVNDLILERQSIKVISNEEERRQRAHVYEQTSFEQKLLMHNYCSHLSNLMNRNFRASEVDDFDHTILVDDIFKAIFESMLTLSDVCKSEFSSRREEILNTVDKFLNIYQHYRDQNDEDNPREYFVTLLIKLKNSMSTKSHDEL